MLLRSEKRYGGAAKGLDSCVYFTNGTGIGVGVYSGMVDGSFLHWTGCCRGYSYAVTEDKWETDSVGI